MIPPIRIALMNIRLVTRTKSALFFTFLFPILFLFVYSGIFARGHPEAVLYMFGPVVTFNIMGSSFFGLGMQSVIQRERGSLRRYRLAPIGAGSMVFSSLLANYLLELPTIALLVICARVFFHMPLNINPFTLLALVTIGTFAFAGFGLTIASIANTMQEAQVFNNVIWFTLLFLSGVTVPLPMLPAWVQRFAVFLPATYLVTSFQAIMVRGQSIFQHGPEMLVLLVSGTFGLLFAWKLFRWEKEEKISQRAKLLSITFIIPFIIMGLWMNMRGDLTASWKDTFSMMSRPPLERPPEASHDGDLLQGFESSEEAENLLKTWQISAAGGAAGHSYGEMDVISPGSAGTNQALRFKGHLEPAPGSVGGSVSARYVFTLPVSDQSPRGIQFDARGDSHQIQITVSPARGETAAANISFVPDADWQTLRLPVAGLASQGVSPSVPPTWVFEIMVQGSPGDFKFDLDELRVY